MWRDSARAAGLVLEDRLRLIPHLVTEAFGFLAQINVFKVSKLIRYIEAHAGIEQIAPYRQRRAGRPRHALADIHAPVVGGIAQPAMIGSAVRIVQAAAGLDRIIGYLSFSVLFVAC